MTIKPTYDDIVLAVFPYNSFVISSCLWGGKKWQWQRDKWTHVVVCNIKSSMSISAICIKKRRKKEDRLGRQEIDWWSRKHKHLMAWLCCKVMLLKIDYSTDNAWLISSARILNFLWHIVTWLIWFCLNKFMTSRPWVAKYDNFCILNQINLLWFLNAVLIFFFVVNFALKWHAKKTYKKQTAKVSSE